MTPFQVYWTNLKTNNPEEYKERLRINRERVRKLRAAIYEDPVRHAAYKQKMRARYKLRVAKKLKTKPKDE